MRCRPALPARGLRVGAPAGTSTWVVFAAVVGALALVAGAGYAAYRLRIRSAMHQEIRDIMAQVRCRALSHLHMRPGCTPAARLQLRRLDTCQAHSAARPVQQGLTGRAGAQYMPLESNEREAQQAQQGSARTPAVARPAEDA